MGRDTEPLVVINLASDPDRNETAGLNGNAVLGGVAFESGSWHQPGPHGAIVVPRGAPLLVRSFFDIGEQALCFRSVTIDAAPFSPLAAAPKQSEVIGLAASDASDIDLARFRFEAPSAPGEWIVRVALVFETTPGPSRQETFFRLRVDVPAPIVTGTATAPVRCAEPGAHPPIVFLSMAGGSQVAGQAGSSGWRDTSSDGPPPIGPRVDAGAATKLTLGIGNNVCAGWWRIDLAPVPTTLSPSNHEPISDLVPEHLGYGVRAGRANRFEIRPLPVGDWVVEATLEFGDWQGQLIGQTTSFWNVVVR